MLPGTGRAPRPGRTRRPGDRPARPSRAPTPRPYQPGLPAVRRRPCAHPTPPKPHPMNPPDEQSPAADAFHAGDHLALQAGAGTGKTTPLALLAHSTTRRGRYLAYNRAIAQDARTR